MNKKRDKKPQARRYSRKRLALWAAIAAGVLVLAGILLSGPWLLASDSATARSVGRLWLRLKVKTKTASPELLLTGYTNWTTRCSTIEEEVELYSILRSGVGALSQQVRREFLEGILLDAQSPSQACTVWLWRRDLSCEVLLECLAGGTPDARDMACLIVLDRREDFAEEDLVKALESCLAEGRASADREMLVDALTSAQMLDLVAFVRACREEIGKLAESDDPTIQGLAQRCLGMLDSGKATRKE